MAAKKQPEASTSELAVAASDWFRQFLKILELFMIEVGKRLGQDSEVADYQLAAMRAVRLTFLDSGLDDDRLRGLLGQVALEGLSDARRPQWNAILNQRRFELIDGEIQGALTPAEQIELTALTQLMRDHLDSEANLPFDGARRLHRLLTEMDSGPADAKQ